MYVHIVVRFAGIVRSSFKIAAGRHTQRPALLRTLPAGALRRFGTPAPASGRPPCRLAEIKVHPITAPDRLVSGHRPPALMPFSRQGASTALHLSRRPPIDLSADTVRRALPAASGYGSRPSVLLSCPRSRQGASTALHPSRRPRSICQRTLSAGHCPPRPAMAPDRPAACCPHAPAPAKARPAH